MKLHLDVIGITDHNTIKGAYSCLRIAQNTKGKALVIPGVEIRTDIGDLTGLFLEEEIMKRTCFEVTEEIKNKGGIIVLPHPSRRRMGLASSVLTECDAVEVINGRSSKKQNVDSYKIAMKFDKPMVAGSDAHFWQEIGTTTFSVDGSPNDEEELRRMIMTGRKEFCARDSCVNDITKHFMRFGSTIVESVRSSSRLSLSRH